MRHRGKILPYSDGCECITVSVSWNWLGTIKYKRICQLWVNHRIVTWCWTLGAHVKFMPSGNEVMDASLLTSSQVLYVTQDGCRRTQWWLLYFWPQPLMGFFPPFLLFNLHFRCEPEVSCVRGRTADYCSTLGIRSFISLMTESITFISHCHLPFFPPSAYNKKKNSCLENMTHDTQSSGFDLQICLLCMPSISH